MVFSTRLIVSIDRLGPTDLYYAQVDAWLDEVGRLPSAGVAQTQVQAAVAAAKDELEGG